MASNGKIPHRWERTTVGDIADVVGGSTPSKTVAQYWNGDIPWATPTDITALRSRYISATETNITKEGLDKSGTRLLPEHSVLMTSRATIGYCAINTCPMATNQGFASLIPKGDLLTEFLYYHLTSRRSELERLSSGSTFLELGKAHLKGLQVLLPPKDVQGRVVNILNSVDEAIEATRAVIDQTRRLKTALLQDLLTNGLPHSKGKSATARFVHRYPKNWTLKSLGHVLAEPIKNGYSPISPQNPTGHWVTTLSAVSESGYRSDGVKPAPLNNSKVHESVLVPGDIIVSRSNTSELVGLAGIYNGQPSPCSYSDLLMRVRVDKSQILNAFALLWLLSGVSRDYFKRTSRGTSGSMKKIDRQILEDLPLPLPPIDEQKEIVAVGSSLDERIQAEETRLEQLCKAKSALSQGLLTGRIPVKGISND